ncbi:MAG: hypothetical protein WAL63_00720, partial [Solirubrobacteraceae bacterium]
MTEPAPEADGVSSGRAFEPVGVKLAAGATFVGELSLETASVGAPWPVLESTAEVDSSGALLADRPLSVEPEPADGAAVAGAASAAGAA